MKPFSEQSALFKKILLSISFASIGFMTLLSLVIYYSNEKLEYDLLEKQVEFELHNIQHNLSNDPAAKLPQTASFSAYLKSRQQQEYFPDYLDTLGPGVHHDIIIDDKSFHILVTPLADDMLYILYDITQIEESEQLLTLILLTAWVLLMLLVLVLAYLLSRKLARPISRLSQEVSQLNPDQRGVQLSEHYQHDEVGRIAEAFDLYLQRMDSYVEKQTAFAAMASHELRSPLTIVRTSADLIDCQHDDPLIRQQVEKIQRAAKGMTEMIDALLQVTRGQHLQIDYPPLRLAEIIDDILASFASEIQSKHIAIHCNLSPDHTVSADRNLVSAVCGNLIKNAIKHGSDSGIRIAMNGDKLSIIDDGLGIGQQELQHIFDFSYRGHSSEGYGIGLYISKLICDHQGWRLELNQSEQGGTCASVNFHKPGPLNI